MKAVNRDILSDNFRLEGMKLPDLKKDLQMMNETTKIVEVTPSDLTLYSIVGMKKNEFYAARLLPDEISHEMFFPTSQRQEYLKREENYGKLDIGSLRNKGFTSEMIKDIYETGFFFQVKVDKRYISLVPSKLFLSTLCNQLDCGKMQLGRNIFRDLYLCTLLQNNESFKIIYRTDNGKVGRILGAASSKFSITPEDTVKFLWTNLKLEDKYRIYYYRITHAKTIINFMKGTVDSSLSHKIYFGCRFSYSDIGRGSYTLESTVIRGGAIMPLDDAITRKHVGEFPVKDFVDNYRKKNVIHKVIQNLNRASKKKISSVRKTVTAFIKSNEFTKVNGAKATKKLMMDEDFFLSMPDDVGTEFDAIYWTGAIVDYYLNQKTDIQYEALCRYVGKIWKEGLKKYAK